MAQVPSFGAPAQKRRTLAEDESESEEFAVSLAVFSGPFEVLLSLITRRKLDITEVALSEVTDEFLAFVAAQSEADLSQVSEFVVVAATLLDLKAARLLPHSEADEEDVELLEARDLLFAKLLQYRAFKEVAADLAARLSAQTLFVPRAVPLEEPFKGLLPEVELGITPEYLAMLAAQALTRKEPTIQLDHIHDPLVSVESQVQAIYERLAVGDRMSFHSLCSDAPNVATVVSRFLAVLDLLRRGEVSVEQNSPLESLVVVRVASAEQAARASAMAAQAENSESAANVENVSTEREAQSAAGDVAPGGEIADNNPSEITESGDYEDYDNT
ncbi:MAG: segregation/condensation protein A [Arcanobacterium sp.]|nr:segregation/condensation protein A [Arcanobacterium sp.]MDY5588440.1 ScpA family protein [Arcanobacterium sp.]